MKSLVQLQRNGPKNAAFPRGRGRADRRIFAISLVHDQLYTDQELSRPSNRRATSMPSSPTSPRASASTSSRVGLSIGAEGCLIPVDSAISLGLIVNEVLMNALKHASPGSEGKPSVMLRFEAEEGEYRLEISDDGPGPSLSEDAKDGLGLKLVDALARNLGGSASLSAIEGAQGPVGARFELKFPCQASPIYG